MSSREQNRAWAMTMAVAAVLAYTTGCTDNNSSSTAESTQTTAAISELEAESTTTDSEHSESTVATPLSDSEQRVDYDDDDKTSTYDTFDAEITLSGTTADVTCRFCFRPHRYHSERRYIPNHRNMERRSAACHWQRKSKAVF